MRSIHRTGHRSVSRVTRRAVPRASSAYTVAAIALIAVLATIGVLSPQSLESSDVRTFQGEYDWTDGGTGRLHAEFKPDGEGSWKVEFDFDFNGKAQKWKGTAEGSLENGSEINGTAVWKKRNWVFSAKIEEGVMRGQHTEIRKDGGRYESGTFEVSE